jgi:hypothetical protein
MRSRGFVKNPLQITIKATGGKPPIIFTCSRNHKSKLRSVLLLFLRIELMYVKYQLITSNKVVFDNIQYYIDYLTTSKCSKIEENFSLLDNYLKDFKTGVVDVQRFKRKIINDKVISNIFGILTTISKEATGFGLDFIKSYEPYCQYIGNPTQVINL